MSAPLSRPLFHGTSHVFKEGDVVTPQKHETAFAAPDTRLASHYAKSSANIQGTLFGQVYEVEPVDPKEATNPEGYAGVISSSKKGYKVKKQVGWA